MQHLIVTITKTPDDPAVWESFVAYYGPLISSWCRQLGLQEADAEDVTQDVLLRLTRVLPSFVYDSSRSFGGWLRTLTQHAAVDYLAKRGPDVPNGDCASLLDNIAAPADLPSQLTEAFDQEQFVNACAEVRLRVAPSTWKAFELVALQDLSGQKAAAQLGMQVMAVYKAKNRVQAMLRQQVRRRADAE